MSLVKETILALGPSINFKIYARISFQGGTALGAEVNHSPASRTEIKNEWSSAFTPLFLQGLHREISKLSNLLHEVFVYFKGIQSSIKMEAPYGLYCK